MAKRQADPAIAELQKAVELDPSNAEAQYQLGYVQHLMKRDAAAAVGPYEKAVAAEPGNVDYRTALGRGAGRGQPVRPRGGRADARSRARPATRRPTPGSTSARPSSAPRRYKDAIAALDKAAAIAPNNVQIETFLAWSYFGLKDSKNFVDHGRKAKALGQKEPTLLGYLTRIEGGEPIK